jgi:chloramphenicol-sensitive protein RarD
VGSFSFEAALVAFGYPVYFGLRRQLDLNHLGGLWFDMTLLLPAAIWFACAGEVNWLMISTYPALLGLIPLLGFLSALALGTYFIAARILSFSVFGLLGYVEPVLLLLVGLILGETIESAEWFTYGPIWLAVFFLVLEGALFLRGGLNKNAHTG